MYKLRTITEQQFRELSACGVQVAFDYSPFFQDQTIIKHLSEGRGDCAESLDNFRRNRLGWKYKFWALVEDTD